MNLFTKFHKPGQGVGYKPPMDSTIFNWLVFNTAAIIVLTVVLICTVSHIG